MRALASMHLDANGTTFLLPEVRRRLQALLGADIGNPQSISAEGRAARDLVETARDDLASLLGCSPAELIFTSSGAEANLTAIRAALRTSGRRGLLLSRVEHSSLTALAELLEQEGYRISWVDVDAAGMVPLPALEQALTADTAVVSLQMVNNETGVIQPYAQAAAIAHAAGALLHTDAAQAVGKLRFQAAETGADYLTLTGHKFHAPQGVGALWAADGFDGFVPLIPGGTQEHGVRGGTHNVVGIVGMGDAARLRAASLEQHIAQMRDLRDRFENDILTALPQVRVNGSRDARVCNTTNLRFDGIDGKALYLRLLGAGIACAQSSACTAQNPEPSRVLRAMGLSYDQAFASIRFSFSVLNTHAEVSQAVETILHHHAEIRRVVGL